MGSQVYEKQKLDTTSLVRLKRDMKSSIQY